MNLVAELRHTKKTMPAKQRYLTSLHKSFSTFLTQNYITGEIARQAENLYLKLLGWKTDYTEWSVEEVNQFLTETQINTPVSPQVQSLLTQFVKDFPPHQANIFLHEYLLAVKRDGCSAATIRNYRSDIRQYVRFSRTGQLKTLFTKPKLAEFVSYQLEKGLKKSSITRKLSSISQFGWWLQSQSLLDQDLSWMNQNSVQSLSGVKVKKITEKLAVTPTKAHFKPGASVVKPTLGQNQRFGIKKRLRELTNSVKQAVPNQTRRWLLPYLNLAFIVLVFMGLGYFGYRQLFVETAGSLAYPSTPTRPNRVLSFQGRLTDSAQNPLTTSTNMRFYLYDALSGGSSLWDSTTCAVTPDQDGIFTVNLGDDCGSEITSDVFSENANIWLEASVEAETLTPRQPIRTVAYALNAETVQGYPIDSSGSGTVNTILTMNSSGDVVLGEVSPKIRAVSGNFTLEGEALTLTTTSGSNGDITLDPDGLGGLISTAYFEAPGATLSATYAGGTALTLKAGPSATADIMEWQNSAGIALGVIDESGNVGIGNSNPGTLLHVLGSSPDLRIQDSGGEYGSLIQSGTGNFNITRSSTGGYDISIQSDGDLLIGQQGNVGVGTAAPLFLLDVAGTASVDSLNINDEFTLPTADGAAGYILQTSGGGVVSWADPALAGAGSVHWSASEGAIYPKNSTMDLLIGGQASASAKFSVLNMDTGLPTASISGTTTNVATYITGEGNLATTNMAPLTLGGSTTGPIQLSPKGTTGLYVADDGNVGVGTTAPTEQLEVVGDIKTSGQVIAGSGSSGGFNVTSYGTTLRQNYLKLYSTNGAKLSSTVTGDLSIGDGETDVNMFIKNDGNVGIGTTAPSEALDVIGNVEFSGSLEPNGSAGTTGQFLTSSGTGSSPTWTSTVPATSLAWDDLTAPDANLALSMSTYTTGFNWATGTGTDDLFSFTTDASADGTGSLVNIQTGTSSTVDPLRVRAGTTEGLMVDSDGNVGIGTTAPTSGYKLDVIGNARSSTNFFGDGGSFVSFTAGGAYLGDTTYRTGGGLGYSSSQTQLWAGSGFPLVFGTAGSEHMRIDSTGNVGIGTTTPLAKLDIDGDLFANTATISATYAGGKGLVIKGGPSGTANIQEWQNSAGTILGSIDSDGYIDWSSAKDIDFTAGGDKGVITVQVNTKPTANMTGKSIAGLFENSIPNSAGPYNTSAYGIKAKALNYDTGGSYPSSIYNIVGGYLETQNAAGSGIVTTAQGLYIRNVNSTGTVTNSYGINIGANIGGATTTNQYGLNIGDQTGSTSYSIYTNAGSNMFNASGDADTDFTIQGDTDADLLFVDASTDQVQIGKLNINNEFTFPTADGTTGYILQTNGGGTVSWADPALAGAGSVHWSASEGAIYPKNSTMDLLIGGQASSSAKFSVLNMDTGLPTASISGTTTNVATYITGEGNLATTNMAPLTLGGSTTGAIQLSPKGTTGLYIADDGNVGIGTTTPSSTLHVNGSNTGTDTYQLVNLTATKTNSTSDTSNATYFQNNQFSVAGTNRLGNVIGLHNQISLSNSDTANAIRSIYGRVNVSGSGAASEVSLFSTHFEGSGTGVISNFYGLNVRNIQNASNTLTNTYGIYIGDLTTGTQTNTPFSIYASDANTYNYLAGNVGIGTTSPLAKLSVAGDLFANTATISATYAGGKGLVVKGGPSGTANILEMQDSSANVLSGVDERGILFSDGGTSVDNVYLGSNAGNIAAGANALDNIGIGENVLDAITTGDGNTVIGSGAGTDLTESSNNILFGKGAGANITTGVGSNVMIGRDAGGLSLTTGIRNVMIGDSAGNAATGSNNLFLGRASGAGNTGGQNVFIGNGTGQTNTGSDNIFIGNQAGVNSTASDTLIVDNQTRADQATTLTNSILYGVMAATPGNQSLRINAIPSINGAYTLPIVDGTTNYVLTTDGAGAASWGDPAGLAASAIYWDTDLGALYPKNSTMDLLIGGQASSSAKFSVLNMNDGTPTASISGTTANVATYITGEGNLATTNMAPLTLGGSTTGPIQLSPKGTTGLYIDDTGNVGIGTTTPSRALDVNGSIQADALYDAANNAYFLDPAATGTSLATAGNIGIGTSAPLFELDVRGDASISGTLSQGPMLQVDAGTCDASAEGKQYYDAEEFKYFYCNGTAWTAINSTGTDDQTLAEVLTEGNTTSANNIILSTTDEIRFYDDDTDQRIYASADGTLQIDSTSLSLNTGSWDISTTGAGTGFASFTASGTIQGGTLTDGTASITSGALSGATGIASSGNIDFSTLSAGGMIKADVTTGRLSVATAGTDYENPLTFTNGLTRTTDTISWGGALTANTTITQDSAETLTFTNAGTGNTTFNLSSTGDFDIQDNGTSAFYVTDGGNVGIGTTAPGEKLTVFDSTNNSGTDPSDYTGGLFIQNFSTPSAGDYATLGLGYGRSADSWYIRSVWNANEDVDLIFTRDFSGAGTLDAVTFNKDGNVGIGTTAPLFNLDVAGNASVSGTLSQGPMLQVDAGTCNATSEGKQYYDAEQNKYYYCNGTSWTAMGSGSGSGYWRLDEGAISPLNDTLDVLIGANATASAKFSFINILEGTPTFSMANQASAIDLTNTTVNALNIESGLMSFDTNNSRIGIGTTTPGSTLEVNGDIAGQFLIADASKGVKSTGWLHLQRYENGQVRVGDGSTADLSVANELNVDGTGDSYIMGNLGIGTTAPAADLHVSGTHLVSVNNTAYVAGYYSTLEGNHADEGLVMGFGGYDLITSEGFGTPESLVFSTYDTGSGLSAERMRIEDGNVGIGDATPTEGKLVVAGRTYTTDLTMTTGASAGYFLTSDASGNASWADVSASAGPWTLSGTDIYPDDISHNVGIGTTAPLTKLDIEGSASTSGTLSFRGTTNPKINILNGEHFGIQTSVGGDTGLNEVFTILNNGNIGIGTTAPGQILHVSGGNILLDNTQQIKFKNASGTQAIGLQMTSTDDIIIGDSAGGSDDIRFYNSTGEVVRIQDVSGSVGIGTTAPDARLDSLATSGEQLRLTYTDGSVYTGLTVDSAGDLTIDSTGGNVSLASGDNFNLTASTDLFFGTTSLGETTSAVDSGAYVVGAFDEFDYSNSTDVQGVLDDLDTTIGGIIAGTSGIWTDAGSYLYPTSAEVLGNATTAGANKLAGAYFADSAPLTFGTDNDVSYSFSGTTLAVTTGDNDINFDSNTLFVDGSANNVGIGTTTPGTKLNVYRNDTVANVIDGGLTVEQEGTGDAVIDLLLSGVTRWRLGIDNSVSDIFRITPQYNFDANENGLAITKTGLVGIGTTAPGAALDVVGDVYVSSGISLYGTAVSDDTIEAAKFCTGDGETNCITDFSSVISPWTDAGTYLHPADGEVLGNPSASVTNKIEGIYMTDSAPLVFGLDNDVTFNFSGSELTTTLGTNTWNIANNLFFLDGSNDLIGIGTNNPLATLDIRSTLGTVPTASISGNTSMATLIVDQSGSGDIFAASSSGETRFVVASDGNVGIGVQDPSSKLEIGGSSSTISNDSGDITLDAASNFISLAGDSLGNMLDLSIAGDASISGSIAFDGVSPATIDILNGSRFDFQTSVGGDAGLGAVMSILNDGNVGIGTTAPGAGLHIDKSFPLILDGGSYSESDLYVLNTNNVNTGVGYAAKVIGVNIQNAVGSANEVYLRSNSGGLLSAGAIYLGSDDANQGVFGVLGGSGAAGTELPHLLTVRESGNVGIGTTAPGQKLEVDGNILLTNTNQYLYFGNTGSRILNSSATGGLFIDDDSNIRFGISGTSAMIIDSSRNVGIGTTAPGAKLSINDYTQPYSKILMGSKDFAGTAADTEIRLTRWTGVTTGRYATRLVQSIGLFNIETTTSTDETSFTPAFTVTNAGNVGIGTTSPDSKLEVETGTSDISLANFQSTSGYAYISIGGSSANDSGIIFSEGGHASTTANRRYMMGYDESADSLRFYQYYKNDGTTAVNSNRMVLDGNGNMGIGDSSPTQLLDVNGNIQAAIFYDKADNSYYLDPAATGTSLATAGDVTIAGGSGKLDVGTIDPPFTINGEKYATYVASMTGVKEETTGLTYTEEYVAGKGYRHTIDFSDQEVGSDLWLFSKATDLKEHLNELVVLLSPAGNARVWYTLDTQNHQLSIYSSQPTHISYRLTAPRFDADSWSNHRTGDAVGFILNDPNDWEINPDGSIFGDLTSAISEIFDNITSNTAQIAQLSVEQLTINGQNIRDYITDIFDEQIIALPPTATSSAQIDQLTTSTIQLQPDAISTQSGEVEYATLNITDSDNNTLAQLNSQGDLTLLGELSAASISAQVINTATISAGSARIDQLEARMAELEHIKVQTAELVNATVSGTLYATQIEGLDNQLANTLNTSSFLDALLGKKDEATESASLASIFTIVEDAGYATDSGALITPPLYTGPTSDVSLVASSAFINDYFSVNGSGYIAQQLGIGEQLLVGNSMAIGDNYIEYQPIDPETPRILHLQPSGQGTLSLMAGLMTLHENGQVLIDGDIAISGDLEIGGTLLTNLIEPTNFGQPLQLKLATESGLIAGVATASSRFEILDQLNNPTATISATGRASFDGGINIGTEDLTPISTMSATVTSKQPSGKATIRQNTLGITIKSALITRDSLIYVSPIGSTGNQILYVKSQTPEDLGTLEQEGGFSVGFDVPISNNATFNWWIIN